MGEYDWNEQMYMRKEKLDKMRNNGFDPFQVSEYRRTHYTKEIIDAFDDLEGKQVSTCGRIMAIRGHGKASFVELADFEGKIQVYVRLDDVGEESYTFFEDNFDVGNVS